MQNNNFARRISQRCQISTSESADFIRQLQEAHTEDWPARVATSKLFKNEISDGKNFYVRKLSLLNVESQSQNFH